MQTSALRTILDKADAFDKITAFISRKKEMESVIRCSFCGRNQDKVVMMVAGPAVYICNNCVDLCTEILSEELELPLVDGLGI